MVDANSAMVIIRFATVKMRRKGIAYLIPRYSGKSWSSGEVMVPEVALAHLAAEGLAFHVEGAATYDRVRRLDREQ
jgi:hypothetical protein